MQSFAQSIDDILTKYEEKNGGTEKFASLTTLQYTSTLKMNVMGRAMDIATTIYTETGKLFRKEMAGMFGMKGVYTLVTDTGGFIFTPSMQSFGDFPGMEGGVKKMDSATYKSCKHKMNAAGDIADLIDSKSKGFVPELIGTEKIDKADCYKIKLTYRDGSIKLFWIDATTYLIKQFELNGKQIIDYFGIYGGPMFDNMMGRNINKQKAVIQCNEYAVIDGIQFPVKQKILLGANDIDVENSDVQMNASIAKKWYSN